MAAAALVRALEAAWNGGDVAAIAALWDTTDAPLYLAEEEDDFFRDWEALKQYWRRAREIGADIAVRMTGVHERVMPEGLVLATWRMEWRVHIHGCDKPTGGETRVAALLRHTQSGLRFAAYVEAPLAPILYLRRLYEERAARMM